jgi:hypothetical protein
MKCAMSLWICLALVGAAMVAAGCEDEVKVHRSYEGEATPAETEKDSDGRTVYQKSVSVESEGFDKESDDNEVKVHRSSEKTTQSQETVVTPDE